MKRLFKLLLLPLLLLFLWLMFLLGYLLYILEERKIIYTSKHVHTRGEKVEG